MSVKRAVVATPESVPRATIVSATTPFARDELALLRSDAPAVLRRHFPDCEALYERRGWTLPAQLDRVYVNERARRDLGWAPKHDFAQH